MTAIHTLKTAVYSMSPQTSYNNVALAHSSYGNLQEGAKNLLHACLISDPEIIETRLALADTCFDKMKQELNDLKSTSFADISVFDAMDGDIRVIDALIVQFREFSRQQRAICCSYKRIDC